MNRISATVAIALALAAIPSASIAQSASRAAIGARFMMERFNSLRVAEVMPGGTGHLMGLRPDDVITHAGGRRVGSMERLTRYIGSLSVGDPVTLTVRRGRETLQLTGTAMARRR
jgi:S1-C subfamily serine protease